VVLDSLEHIIHTPHTICATQYRRDQLSSVAGWQARVAHNTIVVLDPAMKQTGPGSASIAVQTARQSVVAGANLLLFLPIQNTGCGIRFGTE
jgi:hypothetical protein